MKKRLLPQLTSALWAKQSAIRENLIEWSSTELRDFPWRDNLSEPYKILVAETVLKRTTATAAVRVYNTFLERYPELSNLLEASEFDLANLFAPIGLHRQRAMTVIKLASWIFCNEGGVIPSSLDSLLKIPGIGPYSSRAIRSFGFDIPEGIVDGNVARIYTRVFNFVIEIPAPLSVVQLIADKLVPPDHHQAFNFALIDLGGTICRPVSPKCSGCPLNDICDWSNIGNPIQA